MKNELVKKLRGFILFEILFILLFKLSFSLSLSFFLYCHLGQEIEEQQK
jgi:hypothetical protein